MKWFGPERPTAPSADCTPLIPSVNRLGVKPQGIFRAFCKVTLSQERVCQPPLQSATDAGLQQGILTRLHEWGGRTCLFDIPHD
jgi:hypothetical protein